MTDRLQQRAFACRDQATLSETLAGIARRKARAEVAAWSRTLEL